MQKSSDGSVRSTWLTVCFLSCTSPESFHSLRRLMCIYGVSRSQMAPVWLGCVQFSGEELCSSCTTGCKGRPCDVMVAFFTCSSPVHVYLLIPAISLRFPQSGPCAEWITAAVQVHRQTQQSLFTHPADSDWDSQPYHKSLEVWVSSHPTMIKPRGQLFLLNHIFARWRHTQGALVGPGYLGGNISALGFVMLWLTHRTGWGNAVTGSTGEHPVC